MDYSSGPLQIFYKFQWFKLTGSQNHILRFIFSLLPKWYQVISDTGLAWHWPGFKLISFFNSTACFWSRFWYQKRTGFGLTSGSFKQRYITHHRNIYQCLNCQISPQFFYPCFYLQIITSPNTKRYSGLGWTLIKLMNLTGSQNHIFDMAAGLMIKKRLKTRADLFVLII